VIIHLIEQLVFSGGLTMERRRHKRKTIRLNAESITGDNNFSVFIENLSENGISMITAPSKIPKDFTPNQTVKLKLKLSSGEILDLMCKVSWSHRTAPRSLEFSVGLEIIKPPEEYIEFVRSLH
jgi:hypothetical protein